MNENYINTIDGAYFLGYNEKFDYDESSIVIMPISYEGSVSYNSGTANGPSAIIEASHYLEKYDEEFYSSVSDRGIHTLKLQQFDSSISSLDVINKVEEISNQIISDNKFPIMIGGEHSLSLGLIKALKQKYNEFTIIQIDAHTDLENEYKGNKYSHASVMRRVYEIEGINIVQLGIRSISKELMGFLKTTKMLKRPIHTIFAHEFNNKVAYNLAEMLQLHLKPNVFITIDVDGFDPSLFPNTGTPEPNGIEWQKFFDVMKIILKNKNVIGFDFMEFSSNKIAHHSDFSAAKMIYKLLNLTHRNK